MRYMPWIEVEQSSGHSGVDLDYMKMLPHAVLIHSFKRGHFIIFFTTIASIILKVQVVLSPAFFQPAGIETRRPTEVEILDSFPVASNLTGDGDPTAYYLEKAIQDFKMDYPFGVNSKYAYQTFRVPARSGGNNTSHRGTFSAPMELIVDGLSVETNCLLLESYHVSRPARYPFEDPYNRYSHIAAWYGNISIDLQFETCDHHFTITLPGGSMGSVEYQKHQATHWMLTDEFGRNNTKGSCSSLPPQHSWIVYSTGSWGPSAHNESQPHLESCSAALCSIGVSTSKMEVVDDGIRPNITTRPSGDDTRNVRSSIWDIISSLRDLGLQSMFSVLPEAHIEGPLVVDFALRDEKINENNTSLYKSDALAQSIHNITERFGAMVAHQYLRQSKEAPDTALAATIVEVDKLQVNRGICISMAVLFGVCAGIAFLALLASSYLSQLWHRDPATMLGLMAFFHAKSQLSMVSVEPLSRWSSSDKTLWARGTWSPIILRPWFRAFFTIYVVALMVVLLCTLRVSQTRHGLATVADEGYSPLLWKSIPALAMLLVALYANSVDTTARGLSTLTSLSTRLCSAKEIDMSLLDMVGIRALYYSIRLRAPTVTVMQATAILCSVLVTLSSVLFDSAPIPEESEVVMKQKSWFGSRTLEGGLHGTAGTARAAVSGLLLMRNATNLAYPPFTFEDLLFPSLGEISTDSRHSADSYSVQLTVPAAVLGAKCIQFEEGRDFEVDLEDSEKHFKQLKQDPVCPDGSDMSVWQNVYWDTDEDDDYGSKTPHFGLAADPCKGSYSSHGSSQYSPWKTLTYIWGDFSAQNNEFDHLSVWHCNYSWYEVKTDLSLLWTDGDFIVDQTNPPRPDRSTTRPWDPTFNVPPFGGGLEGTIEFAQSVFGYFPSNTTSNYVDAPFRSLTEGAGSRITLQDLGDPTFEDQILESLHSDARFAAAQLANLENRLDLTESSIFPPENYTELPPFKATLINHGRHRLKQDADITYALLSILTVVVIINLWALTSTAVRGRLPSSSALRTWLIDFDLKGQAPEGFNSISMMRALLDGSNYPKVMPENADRMTSDELQRHLVDRWFRMGWFGDVSMGERMFTVGVVGDEKRNVTMES